MLPRLSVNKSGRVFLLTIALWFVVISPAFAAAQTDDPLAPAMESARRKRDPVQLESLKSQLEQRISQNPKDASSQYKLALVDSYLVDVADAQGLASAFEDLAADGQLRRRMGEAGRARAWKHYDLRRMIRDVEEFYREVLSASHEVGHDRSTPRIAALEVDHS